MNSDTAPGDGTSQGRNLRIRRVRPLIAPAILEEEVPLSVETALAVRSARHAVAATIQGEDTRLLMIVGPCSVHDPVAVREYADRLARVAEEVAGEILIVMRVYFEKPRTTVGWKGYINDPDLNESFRVNAGLRGARELLSSIATIGLPTATEFLDTTFGQYYADFISWGAIGARTVESQVHRQLASGLSMPVGIKNATNGNVDVAVDAVVAARGSHLFPSLTREGAPALLETEGNDDCHVVLRGGVEPNYSSVHVDATVALLDARGLSAGIVVDCSHGNSRKDHGRQIEVLDDIVAQRARGQRRLVGVMLESHLLPGRQDTPVEYGRSITDACIGWETTRAAIHDTAARWTA